MKTLQAFTLIELLVAVSIIAILAAVSGKVQKSSLNAKFVSNLKQLALTATLYAQENNGSLPTLDDPYIKNGWLNKLNLIDGTPTASGVRAVKIAQPSKSALFSDTYAASLMYTALRVPQQKVNDPFWSGK